jgi:hypothetical protein
VAIGLRPSDSFAVICLGKPPERIPKKWGGSYVGLSGRPIVDRPLSDDPVVIHLRKEIEFELSAEEANLRTLGAFLILAAAVTSRAPAYAAEPLPNSGSAKLAAYAVCRSLASVDMGPVGSNSSAECIGVVKTRDGSKLLDNLAIRCLEEAKARPEGYAFTGTCVQTDGDGDKIFMTYAGPEGGPVEWIGGTGKYADIVGSGTWTVADAPGNTSSLFVFTLTYDATWRQKEK